MLLCTLVQVAGRRWTVEESFQAGKGLAGLDEHQVRRWTSWRRWTILAMLADTFLAATATTRAANAASGVGLSPLTCNEIRHLLAALIIRPGRDLAHVLNWSLRRRASHAAHESATTNDKNDHSLDHEVPLEY